MYEAFESDEFAELLEDLESDEFAESDEWESDERARRGGARRRLRPKLPTAKRGSPVPKKAGPGFATKADLQATANRLDGRIATNSKSITALDGRTRALETETGRLGAALKKETADRKLETAALKKELDQSRTNALLMYVINQPKTVTVIDTNMQSQKVVLEPDKMASLLPLILAMSTPSSGGGLFGGGGDATSNMLPLLLLAR